MVKTPSLLPPSKPGPRRRSGSGGLYKPMAVERVLAVLVGVVLLVIPLYFWRKPSGIDAKDPAPVDENEARLVLDSKKAQRETPSPVRLGEVRLVRCGDGPKARLTDERCDRVPFFESALVESIRKNADCAPVSENDETVSFVLSIDFADKKFHLWPGQSGTLRRPRANDLLRCVLRDLPTPEWDTIAHKHRFYEIAVMATYSP